MCVLCCTMFLSLSVSGSEMCISHHFGEFASGNSVHWRGRVISRMNNVYRVKELLNVGYGHTRLYAPDLVRSRKLNNCEILWDSLWLRVTETLYSCSIRHTRLSVCYYFRLIIALPVGRLTKRKCYRSPRRTSWTLELSLPQINLFKVVLKSLKLLMESRACLPSPRILRVPCRWAFPIWNNSTREAHHVTLSRALE